MAQPKKKTPQGRRNMRRSHDHLAKPPVTKCPQCGNPKRSHTVCPTCGFYRKREVYEILD
jgi:large subunit ribosomal protein L32